MQNSISENQKWTLAGHGYLVRNKKGKVVYQHREIAEKVLGRKLRRGEHVHHVDSDGTNNKNNNLVICPSDLYHRLLHKREHALNATGHADWLKCCYCLEYDNPENLRIYKSSSPRHGECNKKYYKEWYAKNGRDQSNQAKLARQLEKEHVD